ncbi:MAG: hypothetical protein ABL999_09625 [Pyrinomonadaceae bacterium]
MNVNVSEVTEIRIREIARSRGEDVADVAGSLLAEKVSELTPSAKKQKKLCDMSGMFYGGPGDTAERASEILRAEMGLSSLGRD